MPFDPSLLVHFRQRISAELVNKVNREVVRRRREIGSSDSEKNSEAEVNPLINSGKLILDASCAPGDISYPTDLKLLNQARVQTEKILDTLYELLKEKVNKKLKTYRKLARIDYLEVAKQRRPSQKQKRKAIKKQLQYIKRNLAHISQLIEFGTRLRESSGY